MVSTLLVELLQQRLALAAVAQIGAEGEGAAAGGFNRIDSFQGSLTVVAVMHRNTDTCVS
ncbi:hypothetical protein D9M68_924070 [compost metagenome]